MKLLTWRSLTLIRHRLSGMKDTCLDVKARSRDGREFIIEMQVLNVAGFEKRILYNAAKSYSNQLNEGESYLELNPVIALTITDFIMFEDPQKIINKFCLTEKDDFFPYPNSDLELVFVELPKFDKTEEQLADITDKWLYFLKNARSLECVPQTLAVEQPISKAFQIANKANLTREELDDQERREMFIRDQRGALIKATEQGIKQGLEQGIKQGLEQGVKQGLKQGIEQGIEQGLKRGLLEAISLGLEMKFGQEGLQLYDQISKIDSVGQLEKVKEAIRTASSCREIEDLILR